MITAITLTNIVLTNLNKILINTKFLLNPIITVIVINIDFIKPIGIPTYSLSISQPDTKSNKQSDIYIRIVKYILDKDLH